MFKATNTDKYKPLNLKVMNRNYYENELCELCTQINETKFNSTLESEFDRKIVSREFSGRMTKQRYKLLSRFCRINSFYSRCCCEHDCCGHLVNQRMEFNYKHNLVTVTITRNYNY